MHMYIHTHLHMQRDVQTHAHTHISPPFYDKLVNNFFCACWLCGLVRGCGDSRRLKVSTLMPLSFSVSECLTETENNMVQVFKSTSNLHTTVCQGCVELQTAHQESERQVFPATTARYRWQFVTTELSKS